MLRFKTCKFAGIKGLIYYMSRINQSTLGCGDPVAPPSHGALYDWSPLLDWKNVTWSLRVFSHTPSISSEQRAATCSVTSAKSMTWTAPWWSGFRYTWHLKFVPFHTVESTDAHRNLIKAMFVCRTWFFGRMQRSTAITLEWTAFLVRVSGRLCRMALLIS